MAHDRYSACLVGGPRGTPTGSWQSRGGERTSLGGSVQLIEAGEVHRTTHVVGQVSFFVVWWDPAVIEQIAAELGIVGVLHWKEAQFDEGPLSETLGRLRNAVLEADDALAVEISLAELARELVLAAAEGAPARRPRGRFHPGVRHAVDHIHECVSEPVSLDRLADVARLSKYHFVRCFQAATGVAPHKYLTLVRVREARRLLERGLSVGEAADRVGFADASHLSRTFRKWLGIAPGAWGKAWAASAPVHRPSQMVPRMLLTPEAEAEVFKVGA
jgi:AraC-like DNA-binding protein